MLQRTWSMSVSVSYRSYCLWIEYLEVGFMDQIIYINFLNFLIFKVHSMFSKITVLVCIPTNSVWGFLFLYLPANTCYLCSFWVLHMFMCWQLGLSVAVLRSSGIFKGWAQREVSRSLRALPLEEISAVLTKPGQLLWGWEWAWALGSPLYLISPCDGSFHCATCHEAACHDATCHDVRFLPIEAKPVRLL